MNAIPHELLKEAPRVWRDNGNGVNVRVVDPEWYRSVLDRIDEAREKQAEAKKKAFEAKALKAELAAQIATAQAEAIEVEAMSLQERLEHVRRNVREGRTKLQSKEIIETISLVHGITAEQIKGKSRVRVVINARHHAMYEVRRLCRHLSLPQIGKIFGGRDHATIYHAVLHWPEKAASLGIDCEPIGEKSA